MQPISDAESQTVLTASDPEVRAILDSLSNIVIRSEPRPNKVCDFVTPSSTATPRAHKKIIAISQSPAKSAQQRFYAVVGGTEGSKIYESWAEAGPATHSPGCVHARFSQRCQAEQFIATAQSNSANQSRPGKNLSSSY